MRDRHPGWTEAGHAWLDAGAALNDAGAPLVPTAQAFVQPTVVEMMVAEDFVNRPSLLAAFASCEWDELDENGQVWIAALIREARRENGLAIRWANSSVEMLQTAFFPLADALRNLEAYLRNTPHHNAPEAAAARKALAAFDASAADARNDEPELLAQLERFADWLSLIIDCDLTETVADGGITAGMVVQQEAREQLRRARAAIAKARGPQS